MTAGAAALAVAALVTCQTKPSVSALRPFPARIHISPKQAAVFLGDDLQFAAAVVGITQAYSVRWSLVGPGSIDEQGRYRAPATQAVANVVASAGSGLADSATLQTVLPPDPRRPLALVSCYDDATIDVHDASTIRALGSLSLQGRTAGVALASDRKHALIASDSTVYALDLASMHFRQSVPFSNARFSQAAALAGDLFAVTDNQAQAGQPGVRIFRIKPNGVPVLVQSVIAGETPEGIAVVDNGRTFFIGNINSNEVMRFVLQPDNRVRQTGVVRTGTRPFGIAVDPAKRLLFVADNDTAAVSGSRSHPGLERFALPSMRRVGSVISTGSATSLPLGLAVDEELHRLFVVNEGDGNAIVYDVPSMRRRATLELGLTPWLPSLDSRSHRLFVPNARSNSMDIYDTKSLRAVRRNVPTCSYPTFVGL